MHRLLWIFALFHITLMAAMSTEYAEVLAVEVPKLSDEEVEQAIGSMPKSSLATSTPRPETNRLKSHRRKGNPIRSLPRNAVVSTHDVIMRERGINEGVESRVWSPRIWVPKTTGNEPEAPEDLDSGIGSSENSPAPSMESIINVDDGYIMYAYKY